MCATEKFEGLENGESASSLLPPFHHKFDNKDNNDSDDKHYTLGHLCQALNVKSILLLSLI